MSSENNATRPTDEKEQAELWYARGAEEAIEHFGTSEDGLQRDEAARRLEEVGPNRLPQAKPDPWWLRLLRQFHDVLIYVLIVAAVITALLGEWIDTWVIIAVVIFNALVGFIQEGRAEAALAGIRRMLSLSAVVVRGGERREIDADDLVPGDIVRVSSGDRVPADLRVLRAKNLQVEEAALTGESTPVTKQVDAVDEGASIGDRASILFSGTTVSRGQGTGVVVHTGTETEIGRIGKMIATVDTITTPLLESIGRFGKVLSIVILALAALTFGFGYFFRPDLGMDDLFRMAVGLAVAAIPEGLPAIMTITLALGVQRMARRRAILRRLPAVETLGSVTVIGSDKTGTLTRNEMVTARIRTAAHAYSVEGEGYEPRGEIHRGGEPVDFEEDAALRELIISSVLANDGVLVEKEDGWTVEGDPTDGALIVLGEKAEMPRKKLDEQYPRRDTIPFESENRYMAVLTHEDSGALVHVKGAPERLLEMCDFEMGPNGDTVDLDLETWQDRIQDLAGSGHRVLALARREGHENDSLDPDELEKGLTLLGVVGLIDPPREEVVDAVRECQAAGIRVKMITGDHGLTAGAIAKELGIGDGDKMITGAELERLSEEEFARAADEYDVFARTSPEHKLRLMEALQERGEVVAMTGDGVNDAPALKRADVGVAMGIKGAEASKDAADMVLADDNFATIARAVREGRTIYDNLKKTILFLLPTNGAEALMVIAAMLIVFPYLPITPVMILWVNMVTSVALALALAFEPSEKGVMQRPPRDRNEPILSPYLLWRITFVSVIICVFSLFLFLRELSLTDDVAMARTVLVNVLAVGQFAYLFNSRFIRAPSFSFDGIFGNRFVLLAGAVLFALQLGFTYLPFLNYWFGTMGIPFDRWLWINLSGLLVFLIVEAEKAVMRKLYPPREAQVESG